MLAVQAHTFLERCASLGDATEVKTGIAAKAHCFDEEIWPLSLLRQLDTLKRHRVRVEQVAANEVEGAQPAHDGEHCGGIIVLFAETSRLLVGRLYLGCGVAASCSQRDGELREQLALKRPLLSRIL